MTRIMGKYDMTTHQICNIKLKNGAELHRFLNPAGVSYSAIYLDGEEVWSCEREKENDMIRNWNEN